MHPLKSLRNLIKKVFDPLPNLDLQNVVGWRSIGGSSSYGFYRSNQYENGYSSISKLANGFSVIEPYVIDKKGTSVASNVLDRLYAPNNQMSAYDFREALAVMVLVHDKVHIRVHHRSDRINTETITGFTFIENQVETIVGGKYYYKLQNGEELTDDEVITLKSVNPDNLNDGFSASRAAHRWTTIDDYIADYQKGFFENGAVPSGQLVITAKTTTDFNDIVDMLKARHKGAGNNNNITYTHRPTDQNGNPLNSQIEWVPFSSQNKDMALKDLFDNANKKIDSVYGVPASIRGVNDENSYASIRVDELIFIKYSLNPLALKIWSKFTHELNRITGGLGVGFSYDLEVPQLADEEKVKSEAASIDAATIINLTVNGGYTLESAIAYVVSSDPIKLIKAEVDEDDDPDILDPDEAKDTPDQPIDAYLKAFKVKKLAENDRIKYENELASVVEHRMRVQIDHVVDNFDTLPKAITSTEPIEAAEDLRLTNEMLAVLLTALDEQGGLENRLNYQLIYEAGIEVDEVVNFRMNAEQRIKYNSYVEKVATGYNAETAEKIREVISNGRANNYTASEIKNGLRGLIEPYRIKRIAVTEINRAGNEASLMSMQNIARQTGARVVKEWVHDGGDSPCEFCRAMIGTVTELNSNFVDLEAEVTGADGGVYVNNFVPIDIAELHPHGHCRQIYRVIV